MTDETLLDKDELNIPSNLDNLKLYGVNKQENPNTDGQVSASELAQALGAQRGNIPTTNRGDLPNVAFTPNDDPQPLIDALNALPLTVVPHGWIGMFSTVRITATSSTSFIADKRFYRFGQPLPGNSDANFTYYGQGSGTPLSTSNMKFIRDEQLIITAENGVITGTGAYDLGNIGTSSVADAVNGSTSTYTESNGIIVVTATDGTTQQYYIYNGSENVIGNGSNAVTNDDFTTVDPATSVPAANDVYVLGGQLQNLVIEGVQNEVTSVELLATVFRTEDNQPITGENIPKYFANFEVTSTGVRATLLRRVKLNSEFRTDGICRNATKPDDVQGFITEFGDQEFRGNTNIEEVILPSVKGDLGNRAENCISLTRLVVPNVDTIWANGCTSLTYLDARGATTLGSLEGCPLTDYLNIDSIKTIIGNLRGVQRTEVDFFNLTKIQAQNITQNSLIEVFRAPLLESIIGSAFRFDDKIKELRFLNLLEVNPEGVTVHTFGMTAIELIEAPKCKIFGSDTVNNDMFRGADLSNCKIVVNEHLKTSNNGGINANIQDAIDKGADVVFAEDYAVTNNYNNYVSAFDFGAKGDGVTDDWRAIQNAINSNYSKVIIGKNSDSEFIISQPLIIPKNKTVTINGSVKIKDGVIANTTSDIAIGDTSVQVENADQLFNKGEQVVFYDSTNSTQGGNTNQTRQVAIATTIKSINNNTITIEGSFQRAMTVANGLTIAHCQSCFIVNNFDNVVFDGNGVVDANKEGQADVEPLAIDESQADTLYGCGITIENSIGSHIRGNLKVINAPHQNVNIKHASRFFIEKLDLRGAHDKNLLLWYCEDFIIGEIITDDADFEDGIILHNDCNNGHINSIIARNNGRGGVYISNSNSNITVNHILSENNGINLFLNNSDYINIDNAICKGGGKYRYKDAATSYGSSVYIGKSRYSKINVDVIGDEVAYYGVGIFGECENTDVKLSVNGMTRLASSALILGDTGGQYPQNINILNPIIKNNVNALKLINGIKNIRFFGGEITDNQALDFNNSETKFFNTKGINRNNVEGRLIINEVSTGGSSAVLEQNAHVGQPGVQASRTSGTKENPSGLPRNSGLYRFLIQGFQAVSNTLSPLYQWCSVVTTEAWETAKNGYLIKFSPSLTPSGKGFGLFITSRGIKVANSADPYTNSSAALEVKQVETIDDPLAHFKDLNGNILVEIERDGSFSDKIKVKRKSEFVSRSKLVDIESGGRNFEILDRILNDTSSAFGVNSTNAIDFLIDNVDIFSLTGSAEFHFKKPHKLAIYTVDTLPSGTAGDVAFVTDATNPQYLTGLVGGGSIKCPVSHDGSKWVS